MTEELPEILQPESKEHYEADATNYWRNIKDTKRSGPSADALNTARPQLMTPQQEAEYADRVELAADKTKRTGARVNQSSAVPGLFLHGLKETSDLIDNFTPKGLPDFTPMKPPDKQVAPTGFFPKAAVVLDRCLDCMELMGSHQQYVLGMNIIREEDTHELTAMNVRTGDLVLYNVCVPCFEKAKRHVKDDTPLVLVFGSVIPDKDIALAKKYGFDIGLHDGVERTKGQWNMLKRVERLDKQLKDYLKSQHIVGNSPIFRPREQPNG